MSQLGDTLVLYLLIGVIIYFMLRKVFPFSRLKERLSPKNEESESIPITGKVADILRSHGYEVMDEKIKVPLEIGADGELYQSRLYVDYLACDEEDIYLVLIARERKPLRMSGAALRDYFLIYYLLFEPAGILYVDKEKGSIKLIDFVVPTMKCQKKSKPISGYVFAGMVGIVLGLLIYQIG
ncbi:hypothetical protein [Thermoflavimicrobium daqui]|uniref:Uncharacterized protein n=1 Tax=Thermoflavimicrobium daqui TaxID=2137476 RepID=A0A364K8D8_9BACL|nr:hypothetical protein [Thermoflavimicrobium daqui]RAL26554.1 hypothetical protein DL897_00430 [Thermoflavimicrobium daqui]